MRITSAIFWLTAYIEETSWLFLSKIGKIFLKQLFAIKLQNMNLLHLHHCSTVALMHVHIYR